MGTPLKNIPVLLSQTKLSPLSPRLLSVSKYQNANFGKHVAGTSKTIVRRLDFTKSPTQNLKSPVNAVKIKITDYDSGVVGDISKRDVLINTPNKRKMIKNGLGDSKFLNILGTGTFGKVIRGIYKEKIVAVKIVKNSSGVLKEKNALGLDHENIVRTVDIVENEDDNFSLVVMEYFPNSIQLHTFLENLEVDLEDNIMQFAMQVSKGLEFCHRKGILHLDIKSQNILVCQGICKICDFGNSVKISEIQTFKHRGTVFYTAPELLLGENPTEKCDVYSLGVLLWQLKSRMSPYNDVDNMETVIYKVVKCKLRPETRTPEDDYSKLYHKCWHQDAGNRPNASEVLEKLEEFC